MNEDSSLRAKSPDILEDSTLEKMSKAELIKVVQQLQVQLQTSTTTIESYERKMEEQMKEIIDLRARKLA